MDNRSINITGLIIKLLLDTIIAIMIYGWFAVALVTGDIKLFLGLGFIIAIIEFFAPQGRKIIPEIIADYDRLTYQLSHKNKPRADKGI